MDKGNPYDLGDGLERRLQAMREVRQGRVKRVGIKSSPYDLNAVAVRMRRLKRRSR